MAKQTAIEFVRARSSDRIGLVAFAAQALTQVPLTTDYAVLEQGIRGLKIGMLEDGTAIGTGIATAANRLRRAPGKSKVIVLLTDGVNNRGTVDPRTAAQAAESFGIRIYTIGVGTRGQAPVPMGQGLEGLRYQMMPVEIDEPLLTEIASTSGGRYFRATDTESLRHIFDERTPRLLPAYLERVARHRDGGDAAVLAATYTAVARKPFADAFARLWVSAAAVREVRPEATVISAGMSGDLEAAVEAGATHLRIGTALLGDRGPRVR